MKNGHYIKGHKRTIAVIGTRENTRSRSTGGIDVGCICGWSGGNWPTNQLAYQSYRGHLDHLINECLFTCKSCGEQKPLNEMRADYRYMCLQCFSAKGNEWQRKHPVQSANHKRSHHLFKNYGITLEESNQILINQGGLCAICREDISDPRSFSLHVDHDHATNNVRGILCFRCNVGLGSFKDDISRLESAIEYLKRSQE